MFIPWNTQTPYTPPIDPMEYAKWYNKRILKAAKKAAETEAAKHKKPDEKKDDKKKNPFQGMDLLHMMLAVIVVSPFLGPFIGIQMIHFYKGFAETISTMLK